MRCSASICSATSLIRPALREADVDSERLVILEELAMDDDSPDDVAHRAFAAQLFADHPLGRETGRRSRSTVQAITPPTSVAFFESHYHAGLDGGQPAPGRSNTTRCWSSSSTAFAGVGRPGSVPGARSPASIGDNHSIDDDTEQVHIVMGGRSLARGDDDREALDVVNHVFGGGSVEPAVRRDPRTPRSGLLGVLRRVGLCRQRRVPDVRGHPARACATTCIELMRAELDRLVRRRHLRRRARCRHRAT